MVCPPQLHPTLPPPLVARVRLRRLRISEASHDHLALPPSFLLLSLRLRVFTLYQTPTTASAPRYSEAPDPKLRNQPCRAHTKAAYATLVREHEAAPVKQDVTQRCDFSEALTKCHDSSWVL